jgi:MFS family permease
VEPSFRATITDLLSKEEYTKASGLVSLSGSARYLLSPVIAGVLFMFSDIKLLLFIDMCTIFITVITTTVVRQGIDTKPAEKAVSIRNGFKVGWTVLVEKKGVLVLAIFGSAMTFFIAAIQTLSTPMILAFTDKSTLGVATTVCALGMLISSLILGVISIKKDFIKIMTASLFFTGVFMVAFGSYENLICVCVSGFLFFMMLPFSNTCIDYLIRTNIDNEVQGRVWGLISIISQLGYVVAYAVLGPLADYVFVPLLVEGGPLAANIGAIIGVGSGRGIGLMIIIAGLLLALTSILFYRLKSVRGLESRGAQCTEES